MGHILVAYRRWHDLILNQKFRKMRNPVAIALLLPILSQCTTEKSPDNAKVGDRSLSAKGLQCTKIGSNHSTEFQEYALTGPKNSNQRSDDCRLAERLITQSSGTVKVTVRHITPQAFDGVSECDQAGFDFPLPNGNRIPLSTQLQNVSFNTQIRVSVDALNLPKCLARMFPTFSANRTSSIEWVGTNWLNYRNEKPTYEFASAEVPVEVAPVAVVRQGGILQELACAEFVYSENPHRINLNSSEIYTACLSNLSRTLNSGEY